MHHDDRYDLHHAELASGEGMPEPREPHSLQVTTTTSPPPDGTAAPAGARPSA